MRTPVSLLAFRTDTLPPALWPFIPSGNESTAKRLTVFECQRVSHLIDFTFINFPIDILWESIQCFPKTKYDTHVPA